RLLCRALRHPLCGAREARRGTCGAEQRREGPRGQRRDSSTSHAGWATAHRREGDCGVPGCQWPSAAAAERLGREVRRNHETRVMKFAVPFLVPASLFASATAAQAPMPVIAVPPLTTPNDKSAGNGSTTLSIAWQASQLIAQDLRSTGEMMAIAPDQKDYYSYPEVTAPTFSRWRSKGAKFVLTGFVRSRPDGRLTVGCYVYDTVKGRELGRTGFVVAPEDWRRAAHKCSGIAYTAATGAPGIFDTRIAYVAESGPPSARVKRIAIMDGDGNNQSFVTAGDTIVLTPRLSPKAENLAFV